MALNNWIKELENKKFGMIQTIHYFRKDKGGILTINLYEDGYHLCYFPIDCYRNPVGKYFCINNLDLDEAIKKAKEFMGKN